MAIHSWNSADKSATITLSGSNLTATKGSTGLGGVRSTANFGTRKVYFEIDPAGTIDADFGIGVAMSTATLTNLLGGTNSVAYYNNGEVWTNNVIASTIATWTASDIICVAWDGSAELIWFRVNGGNWNNSGTANPATGTGGISCAHFTAAVFAVFQARTATGAVTANFGASAFSQTVPSGFSGIDTSVSVTGVAGTGGAGTVAFPNASVSLTGVAGTGQAGAVTVSGPAVNVSTTLTGVEGTGKAGNVAARRTYPARFTPSEWAASSGGVRKYGLEYAGYVWIGDAGDSITPDPRTYAITSQDNRRIRFEVQDGDQLRYSGYDDIGAERAEIGGDSGGDQTFTDGTPVYVEYMFMVPTGSDLNGTWMVNGQFHADTSSSPPFEMGFRSGDLGLNRWGCTVRAGSSSSFTETYYDLLGAAIERDRWYHVRISYCAHPTTGFIHVDIDGVRKVTVTGHQGYSDQTYVYWRFGIYRNSAMTGTTVVEYDSLQLGTSLSETVQISPPNFDARGYAGTITQSGSASGNVSTDLTGVKGTGNPGTITANTGSAIALVGTKGTGNAGSITTRLGASTALTGVAGTGFGGTIGITAGGSITVNVDGVGGSGQAGAVAASGTITGSQPVSPGAGGGGPASERAIALDEAHQRRKRERERAIERTIRGEVAEAPASPPASPAEVKTSITSIDHQEEPIWVDPGVLEFGIDVEPLFPPPPPRVFDPEDDAAVALLLGAF